MLYPGRKHYELTWLGRDVYGCIGRHPGLACISIAGVVGPEESIDTVAFGHAHVAAVQIIDRAPG